MKKLNAAKSMVLNMKKCINWVYRELKSLFEIQKIVKLFLDFYKLAKFLLQFGLPVLIWIRGVTPEGLQEFICGVCVL